ncbi:hypothetical protein Aeqsu_0189 [Aequorivita sublithincola DSM 14238]|uniref:DUF4407 domain-containing protein n=1 Tax=Aequorivita sublithincola (strain DSM 14238 / LMG 21431 / ACAM 643 / 9-3) TaxID=746697 RepID=I3YRU6_AEQSU|nr:DUF4407 domain-containing protein [Aequorivita sublithincola]AFL79714.1 hypothetical protein Aeqsu_0189 [Aequorivita sublithincola DSM 14238]
MKLLWKAAGSDSYILQRSTYSDQVKYACLGGVVVATGFMAALAGGYAMYTIFEPNGSVLETETHWPTAIKAILFGVIWGLIIFNIDRFIVAASGVGDGTEKITLSELGGAIPRLCMGIIIAITISKPVEIRMFKSEIDSALYAEQQELQKTYEVNTRENYAERFNALEAQVSDIDSKRGEIMQHLTDAENNYADEIKGKNNAPAGVGRRAEALKVLADKYQVELVDFDKNNADELLKFKEQREILSQELDTELKKNQTVAAGLDGLLERIKLAHELAGFWISLFITLLFMAIELTPIFFKMMLTKGPYNYMGDNVRELLLADQGIEIHYDYYQDKKGQERIKIDHHQALKLIHQKKQLLLAQQKLNENIIDKWVQKEIDKLDSNLEDYITTNKS